MAQSTASATPEAAEARITQRYAFALRRLYRRRQAIRSAAPFSAAIIAVAESWLYANGTLCHVLERTLRVLDLHKSGGEETVIDVRALLDEAVAESRGTRKYKLQILHYAEGIVSCLYTHSRPLVESWLIVFNVQKRELLTSLPLESSYKIFVRNDSEYLYFGTHSEFGEDGFRRWALMGYDLQRRRWFEQKVHLIDMVGSDIGQSIAFEIIDKKFYGLSNQASFEVDEVDWKSYYHCFRFPVDAPKPKETERSVKEQMWRRQHAEGPIDDRWSFVRIIRDDRSPKKLHVLESRKEWLHGQSSGRRNYYTTELVFPPSKEEDQGEDVSSSTPHPNDVGGGIVMNPDADINSDARTHPALELPKSPEFRTRCPLTTHTGDDASTALMFTLSKCHIRSYHPSSQAFLDLVDNPSPQDPGTPRLQLRAGSRQLRPQEEILREPAALDAALPHTERIKRIYRNGGDNKITFWPPESPSEALDDPAALDDLHRVLNPPSHTGNVKGAWDDRSMVYSTSHADGMQALVFISFDPAIRLQGLREWGGESLKSKSDEAKNFEKTVYGKAAEGGSCYDEGKGKGKEVAAEPAASPPQDVGVNSPLLVDEYYAGYTPPAMDWATDVLGPGLQDEDEEEEEEEEAEPAASDAVPATGPKDTDGDAPPEPVAGSPSADVDPSGSPQLDGEPRSASPSASEDVSKCAWARTEPAMYREIAFGFNNIPDFTSPRRRKRTLGDVVLQ